MDLICGLPGEDGDVLLDNLEQALALEPASISLHSLALKRGSRLATASRAGADETELGMARTTVRCRA